MPLKYGIRKKRYGLRRRRVYRRRVGGKSRQGINRSYTAPKNFVETIKYATLVSPAGTDPLSGGTIDMSFKANILPNLNTLLVDMYRQFCIRGVKVIYKPAYTNYQAATGLAIMPKVYFAEDKTAFEVDSASGNIGRIMTQDNCRTYNANRAWSTYVRFPKPLLLQETAVAGQQIAVQTPANKPLWLPTKNFTSGSDEAGTEVEHNVGRMVCDANNAGVSITMGTIFYKVYYSVKEQTQSTALTDPVPQ